MGKKRISIKDIAALVGVSHPTVSRALRGKGRMSEETRARIVAVAQEVGYTPSLVARGLVTQRSYCVGLIVPTFSDSFHSTVAQSIEEVARGHHYSLFLASTDIDPEHEWDVARSFISRQVDGIIVSSSWVGDRYAELTQETGIPVVLINPMVISRRIHAIRHDDYRGGCAIMRYLLQKGYRRIAYLGNARAGEANAERKQAWRELLHAAHLAPQPAVLVSGHSISCGRQAAAQLLDQVAPHADSFPDAIYCYNDALAIGAMSYLRDAGLRIPHDVAITGFDDLDIAAIVEPPLTTLRQPRAQMGAHAMQILLTLIDHTQQGTHEEPNGVLNGTDSDKTEDATPTVRMAGELIIRRSA